MRFTVVWLPLATQQLAALWLGAADRNAVTVASEQLDQRLALDPMGEGESRSEDHIRISFEHPLRILFRVFPDRNEVHVYSIGTYARRR